jgi:hypothetical protein
VSLSTFNEPWDVKAISSTVSSGYPSVAVENGHRNTMEVLMGKSSVNMENPF